jgi:catechol 2,3-dioxygenase
MHNDDCPTEGTDAARPGVYGLAPRGYRLPETTRLGHVHLQVADLERSLAYYRDGLGFRVLHQSAGQAALGADGADAPLVMLSEKKGAAPVPPRGRLGLYHFAILLPDRQSLGRLVTHLAEIGAPAGASDHDVSEALYLQDPDGLGIEIYADRPRPTWRHQGREVLMTTKALDLADLVRSAGDQRWTGMPAATHVGHVHLHVGDLDAAKAYYHEALGLDVVVWSYAGALFLSAGGYHHHLGLNTWAGPGAVRPQANDARLLEWSIVLPHAADAAAAAQSLQAAGYEVSRAEGSWLTADPWGTTLRLVSCSGATSR